MEKTLDSLIEGCQIIDFDWRYLYVNESVIKQSHQTKEGLVGHTMMEVYPGIDKTEMFVHLRNCMSQRKPQCMENEFTYPNGQKAWFELHMQPIPEGVFIFSADITERKKYEEIIENERLKDKTILSSIGEGLIATDKEGRIILINESAQDMLGYHKQDVLWKLYSDVIPALDNNNNPLPQKKRASFIALSSAKTIKGTYYYITKDKRKIPVSVTASPIIRENMIIGTITAFSDITKEREVDQAKSEFISIASHALRTPLGIARWYMEVLQQETYVNNAPENVKKYLKEIYKSNERLLILVRSLLYVSRIDQGKVKNDPELVNAIDVIKNIITQLTIIAAKNNITIHLTIKQEEFPTLFLDVLQLQEVIENLITNAIKYNVPNGNIEIIVDKKNDTFLIDIQDTGIGISEEDQKNLFTKFFRAKKAIRNNTEGSGLGLYVVKSYIESWGGKISVESQEGKGTRFSLIIPYKTQKDQKIVI